MTNPATTSLLDRANLDRDAVRREVARGLEGADDGELFLEYGQTEALVFDNGRLKQATYDTSQGFGLRAVKDEAVGYAHSSDVSIPALIRAADAVARRARRLCRQLRRGAGPHQRASSMATRTRSTRPASRPRSSCSARSTPMSRDKDPRVRQVSASLAATWQVVEILRPDGESYPRHPPAGARQRLRRRRPGRPAGERQQGLWRPRGLCALHRDQGLARRRRRRAARGAGQSRIDRRRPPARWTWCSAPAGPA